VPALRRAGLSCHTPEATFYVWCKLAAGLKSEDFVLNLIRKQGIVSTPGTGFGLGGEGFVRFTLCSDASVLKQVAEILSTSI
jgi:aspartate/methionine/tyrosine aminotransferase